MRSLIAATVLLLVPLGLSAQWFEITHPDTPRNADGSPDLTAPAPQTPEGRPDLSGIWGRTQPPDPLVPFSFDLTTGTGAVLLPDAEAVFQARRANDSLDMPSALCLPHGLTKAMYLPEPFKLVQTPGLILILHEEFNNYRQIFTDGRSIPDDWTRTWFGHSTGHWETDGTLVVETVGLIDDMWLDVPGHPATEALRIIERFRRVDFGNLEVDMTIDDAGAYEAPWTTTLWYALRPDTELIESICESP